jgi:hypothetical protein
MEMVAAVPMRKEGMERPRATTEGLLVQSAMGWVMDVLTGDDGCDCGADSEQGRECICPAQSLRIDESH